MTSDSASTTRQEPSRTKQANEHEADSPGLDDRVYNFDADAPPEQKKAQALKGARDKLAPLSDKLRERHEGGAGALCSPLVD